MDKVGAKIQNEPENVTQQEWVVFLSSVSVFFSFSPSSSPCLPPFLSLPVPLPLPLPLLCVPFDPMWWTLHPTACTSHVSFCEFRSDHPPTLPPFAPTLSLATTTGGPSYQPHRLSDTAIPPPHHSSAQVLPEINVHLPPSRRPPCNTFALADTPQCQLHLLSRDEGYRRSGEGRAVCANGESGG